jgi:hypothetical protein
MEESICRHCVGVLTFKAKSGLTQRAATVFRVKSKTTIKRKNNPFQAEAVSRNGC